MECLKKIVAAGFIGTLALFAGSSCPYGALAASDGSSVMMVMTSMTDGHTDETGGYRYVVPGDGSSLSDKSGADSLRECVFHCSGKVPEAISAKKFSVDVTATIPITTSDRRSENVSTLFFALADTHDLPPPLLEELSSVSKKE